MQRGRGVDDLRTRAPATSPGSGPSLPRLKNPEGVGDMPRKVMKPLPSPERGKRLWDEITSVHELSPEQRVILEEACRCADRLDQLDDVISGKGVLELMHFRHMFDDEDNRHITLTVDAALSEARQQQTVLKQLLVSLRLPDQATGQRPQRRGARGAYQAGGGSGDGSPSALGKLRSVKGEKAG